MSFNTFTAFRLPFVFDLDQLQADLNHCLQINWNDHFNQQDYSGTWTAIALRSQSGDANLIYAHPDKAYQDTLLLAHCTYFQKLLQQFHCELQSVRLLRLTPNSIIKPHRDMELAYRYGNFRLHIPIQTDDQVDFIVGGERLTMQAGECWYADFDAVHEVVHRGTTDRIHLVIDGLRNTWMDEQFAEAGYDFELEKKQLQPKLDQAMVQRMISELENQNNPTAQALIIQLRSSLHQ